MIGRLWRRLRPGTGASWGVAMLAREPATLLLTHLAWHIAAGAREVHLFLDDPEDPVADAAAALPGVRVIHCDARFWATHRSGRRPAMNIPRQIHCATMAYRRAEVDWLLHCDADEFVLSPGPLGDELSANRGHPGPLVLPVRERVHLNRDPETLFDGLFRVPQRGDRERHPLLEPVADLAPLGVVGHNLGKSLTPTGLDVELHPHFPRPTGGNGGDGPPRRHSTQTVLLHFDGLTPLHWLLKLLRRAPAIATAGPGYLGPHRRAQVAALLACSGDRAAMLALCDRLQLLQDPEPFLKAGLVEARGFDPAPACRQVLGYVPDFSVASFNAALLRGLDPSEARALA